VIIERKPLNFVGSPRGHSATNRETDARRPTPATCQHAVCRPEGSSSKSCMPASERARAQSTTTGEDRRPTQAGARLTNSADPCARAPLSEMGDSHNYAGGRRDRLLQFSEPAVLDRERSNCRGLDELRQFRDSVTPISEHGGYLRVLIYVTMRVGPDLWVVSP
jgi:hypothetical protein